MNSIMGFVQVANYRIIKHLLIQTTINATSQVNSNWKMEKQTGKNDMYLRDIQLRTCTLSVLVLSY